MDVSNVKSCQKDLMMTLYNSFVRSSDYSTAALCGPPTL